jgi:AcrR family transcriptional regulator
MIRKTKEEVLAEYRCATIQAAAMAVLGRKGADDATMQEIADEAGVAKGTLYVYFRDRDELLTKTAGRAVELLVDELEEAFSAEGAFEARLSAVVLKQLQFFDEHRELFRAYLAMAQRDTANGGKRRTADPYGRFVERLEVFFAAALKRGEIRKLEPRRIAAVYRDIVRGVVVRRIEEKAKTPREEEAAFIVSILLGGIRRDR